MADLGCNAFDATHDPPSGSGCPDGCSGICCDTDPEDKYLTVTANNNPLSPAISGSSNMPANGRFFAEWNTDCAGSAPACSEAGRSPCDGAVLTPVPNKRVVTIPAATWNAWLGGSGNTMTIRVSASSAIATAPIEERSLALYCEELGFNQCPFQDCEGLCGPETFSRVTISYAGQECVSNADCDDGLFCNGAESCDASHECQPGTTPCPGNSAAKRSTPATTSAAATRIARVVSGAT